MRPPLNIRLSCYYRFVLNLQAIENVFRVYIAWYEIERGWENLRQLCYCNSSQHISSYSYNHCMSKQILISRHSFTLMLKSGTLNPLKTLLHCILVGFHNRTPTQRVFINQNSSKSFNIDCGVPQGSYSGLGPILFIMYLGDSTSLRTTYLVPYVRR